MYAIVEINGQQFKAEEGVRQRGNKHFPGENVAQGKDDTLYALADGIVYFHKGRKDKSTVSVLSPEVYAEKTKKADA